MESLAPAVLFMDTQSETFPPVPKDRWSDTHSRHILTYMAGFHFKRNVKLTLTQNKKEIAIKNQSS